MVNSAEMGGKDVGLKDQRGSRWCRVGMDGIGSGNRQGQCPYKTQEDTGGRVTGIPNRGVRACRNLKVKKRVKSGTFQMVGYTDNTIMELKANLGMQTLRWINQIKAFNIKC